jgi:hypothetical protein
MKYEDIFQELLEQCLKLRCGGGGETSFILPVHTLQPLHSLEDSTESIAHSDENGQAKYFAQ